MAIPFSSKLARLSLIVATTACGCDASPPFESGSVEQGPDAGQADADRPVEEPCQGFGVFADPAIEAHVRSVLELKENEPLTARALAKLDGISVPMPAYESLAGFECLTSLEWLQLWPYPDQHQTAPRHPIPDLSPLSGLPRLTGLSIFHRRGPMPVVPPLPALTFLALEDCELEELPASAIANLEALEILDIPRNRLTNVAFLEAVPSVTNLNIASNSISDLGPVAALPALTTLRASDNAVTDLGPLSALAALTALDLTRNTIEDLSPLAGLVGLVELGLASNPIQDHSALSGLRSLAHLYLNDTGISDLTPLAGLRTPRTLLLDDNAIEDITPLAAITSLRELSFNDNAVADLSPLVGLDALEILDANDNAVSDLSPLLEMSSIDTIGLERNRVDCDEQADTIAALLAALCGRTEPEEQSANLRIGCPGGGCF